MRALAMLLMLMVGFSQPALGDDTAKWGQVGGWEIRVDRTVGDGCFAMQVFERGTILRIGFDVTAQKIYLVFGHEDWKSIEVGKIYQVKAVFDGISSYDGEMKGQAVGNRVFLVHQNLSTDFVKDFMARNGMQVFYRGERIANLSLRNTYAAVAEVLNCQREMGTGRSPVPRQDPFASGRPSPRNTDPFR